MLQHCMSVKKGAWNKSQASVLLDAWKLEIYNLVDILDEKIQSKSMDMHLPHLHRYSTRHVLDTNPKL